MLRRTLYFLSSKQHKRTNLPHVVRERVWNHYVGSSKGETSCFCCEKNIITPFKFECAHIVADSKGGSSNIDNLLPCCSQCNRSMGSTNFFVFKSKILNNYHYDQYNLSEIQSNVIKYYNEKENDLTCKEYMENFDKWMGIISKNMDIDIKTKNNELFNKILCNCGYNFTYVTHINGDFKLTCEESKQNIIDVICDHIPCLISNKKFVNDTINTDNYNEWNKIKKSQFKK
jgi:hypothetical protein